MSKKQEVGLYVTNILIGCQSLHCCACRHTYQVYLLVHMSICASPAKNSSQCWPPGHRFLRTISANKIYSSIVHCIAEPADIDKGWSGSWCCWCGLSRALPRSRGCSRISCSCSCRSICTSQILGKRLSQYSPGRGPVSSSLHVKCHRVPQISTSPCDWQTPKSIFVFDAPCLRKRGLRARCPQSLGNVSTMAPAGDLLKKVRARPSKRSPKPRRHLGRLAVQWKIAKRQTLAQKLKRQPTVYRLGTCTLITMQRQSLIRQCKEHIGSDIVLRGYQTYTLRLHCAETLISTSYKLFLPLHAQYPEDIMQLSRLFCRTP